MNQVRSTVGNDREDWRLAMQAEVDSLRENNTFEIATSEELRKVHAREILPMKLVTGIKADSLTQQKKKKARAVVCGNFQRKTEGEELYTANADITSVRAVLAASVQLRFGCKVLDVKTAFLNAHLPDSFETVFVRPPQVLVEFGLVAPGTILRAVKAIYGLRISPKAWGLERGRELKKMSFKAKGKTDVFKQSAIDPALGPLRAETQFPRALVQTPLPRERPPSIWPGEPPSAAQSPPPSLDHTASYLAQLGLGLAVLGEQAVHLCELLRIVLAVERLDLEHVAGLGGRGL